MFQGGQHIYERLDKDSSNEDLKVIFHEARVKVLSHVSFLIIIQSWSLYFVMFTLESLSTLDLKVLG